MAPTLGIGGPDLGFDQQGNRRNFITAIPQGVAMTSLQHQKTLLLRFQPAPWLGRVLQVQSIQQRFATGLTQLNQHDRPPSANERKSPRRTT